MEFIDLKKQYSQLKDKIDMEIAAVLQDAHFISGKQVKELELALAEYVGMKYCVSCGNGTDALSLAMMAYGLKEGDAVFVPTFTFYASAETISLTGATPIFVDIDPDTFNMATRDLERTILEVKHKGELNLRAIVAVDLFGLPSNFKELNRIAKANNLLLIEDGAQGFGGSMDGQKACAFGDIATTSFFPVKPLGCYGDGGAVFTNEEKVKDYLESIKVHGKGADKYDKVRLGLNSRLDTLQAAVLKVKLDVFKKSELEERQRVADEYRKMLGDCVKTPVIPNGFVSSYAQYSILLANEEQRNVIQQELNKQGIPTMIYYKKSMHQQTVYRNNPSIYHAFPKAEMVSSRILNLPMHPYLEHDEIQTICEAIKCALKLL